MTRSRIARFSFWIALAACGVLGFLGAMGRGPGLLLAVFVLAIYGAVRGDRLPSLGYLLLTAGILGIALLWFAVPLL